jgi:hypothetical protein
MDLNTAKLTQVRLNQDLMLNPLWLDKEGQPEEFARERFQVGERFRGYVSYDGEFIGELPDGLIIFLPPDTFTELTGRDIEPPPEPVASVPVLLDAIRKLEAVVHNLAERQDRSPTAGPEPGWLSMKDAERYCSLSRDHIERAVKRRELVPSNQGNGRHKHNRFSRTDLDALMESRKAGRPAPPTAKPPCPKVKTRPAEKLVLLDY